MKKKTARKIREITEVLGEKVTVTWEWVPITGEDLLLCGHRLFHGQKIDRKLTYELKVPVYHHHSREKELKKEFQQHGQQGIYGVVRKEYDRRFNEKQ